MQVCAGQPCGIEAAIHAMESIYEEPDTEAILMVDAKNAFNSLNRQAALRLTSGGSAPGIYFRSPHKCVPGPRPCAQLFVGTGGQKLLSMEGTTQGDPLAMAMYGIAVMPLICWLADQCKQIWYADDANGGGRISQLKWWWDLLTEIGPSFGYYPNAEKTWLLVKEEHSELATTTFQSTGVQITTEGRRLLGAPLGTLKFKAEHLNEKVSPWTCQIVKLAAIARTQPHAAVSAFKHALLGRLMFLARVTSDLVDHIQPLETEICRSFLPSLTGRPAPSEGVRSLLALPPRLGGLGIINPTTAFQRFVNEHKHSKEVCKPLTTLIVERDHDLSDTCSAIRQRKKGGSSAARKGCLGQSFNPETWSFNPLPEFLQRAMEVALDKGVSHWLSAMPMEAYGFALAKGSFRNALCLRYGWTPPHLPLQCPCGKPFDTDHALSCGTGGYSILRHNEIRDFTASLLDKNCSDVQIEPTLIPLSGEAQLGKSADTWSEARLDVSARGFWGDRFARTMFDVNSDFPPKCSSVRTTPVISLYARHNKEKRRRYE